MRREWLKEALFAGQTANGFKLGIATTQGWFWTRSKGSRLIYRGNSMEAIDFENVIVAADIETDEISIPDYLPHEAGEVYFYVIRCTNRCGQIEQTMHAAVKIAIDSEGKLESEKPNAVFELNGRQGQDGAVEIGWKYEPIGQGRGPQRMKVYSDGGSGNIDYENPIATVKYKGRRFYRYEAQVVGEGRFKFGVKAEDAQGNESVPTKEVEIEVQEKGVNIIEIISTRNV